jgi:hypothetical protein
MKSTNPLLLAYYLPQFYPIPENDEWWGKGFTEWTNVTSAKSLFKGHNQPRFPSDLGYYDLRVSETRDLQAQLAKKYGISGFCYYNYWFGRGRKILDRIPREILNSGKPDFPFCFCWANESWKGVWYGVQKQEELIKQEYLGKKDYEEYFYYLLDYFKDSRYIKVDGKPFFQIYKIAEIPDLNVFVETFRDLALKEGFPGMYLVAGIPATDLKWDPRTYGFDAVVGSEFSTLRYWRKFPELKDTNVVNYLFYRIKNKLFPEEKDFNKRKKPVVIEYEEAIKELVTLEKFDYPYFPVCIHDWDNSPRSTSRSLVFHNSTPELFRKHLKEGLSKVRKLPTSQQFVFLKSWNEWGESNALEPDKKWGHGYLNVIREEVDNYDFE